MLTKILIAGLIYGMVQAVLFGIGTVLVASTPLAENARTLMPWVVGVSFGLAVPLTWYLVPRMRARFWRKQQAREDAGLPREPRAAASTPGSLTE